MGVYHYTLRKPHLKVNILGVVVPVHAFSYAFKYSYREEEQKRQTFICDNAARVWEKQPLPQFCFVGDMPTKEDRAKGWLAQVNTDLTNYGWNDTNLFPGRAVGGLLVQGRTIQFLNARDYLIEEHQRNIKSMMCSPTQPAIARHKLIIEYLKDQPSPEGLGNVEQLLKQAWMGVQDILAK
jgi:hypothetical protein